jgi:tetratricopeptide (TPR) repeat protein
VAEVQQQTSVGLTEQEFAAAKGAGWKTEEVEPLPGIPEVKAGAHVQECLAIALDHASRAQVRQARQLVSKRRFDEAVPLYKKAIAADPSNAPARYYLAWMLATCPQANLRDGALAITHAKRACELSRWEEWMYIFCLSVAEAEAGRFDDAVTHLKQALDKAPADRRTKYGYLEQRFKNRQKYSGR